MSYAELQEKMNEVQKKLFDPDIEEKESEALNIEYEKLVTELESTNEFKAEKAAEEKAWRDENIPLNAYDNYHFYAKCPFLSFISLFTLIFLTSQCCPPKSPCRISLLPTTEEDCCPEEKNRIEILRL